MNERRVATGVNPTPSGLWVYWTDRSAAVSRVRAVKVPWPMIADVYPEVCDQVNREFAKRIKAMNDADQPVLPLEPWE